MKSYTRKKRSRFVILFYFTVLLFILLVVRLVKLQACEHEKFLDIAKGQHEGWSQIHALRGAIFDRNGANLAFSLAMPSVAANPAKIINKDQTAFYLALALGKQKKEIMDAIDIPGTFAWIARKVDAQSVNKIKRLSLPGIFIIDEPSGRRFYPKGKIASHVLGYAGIDDQGLEGVEASYDQILSGKSGSLEAEMDQIGRIMPGGNSEFTPPTPGKDIYLTIDETIQFVVEKELEAAVKKHNAAGGSIIVYDPRTGDVLAMASYPSYSPSKGSTAPRINVRNRGVCDSYEPGSTFKVILAAAALDSGKVTTKDQFFCGRSLEVGGYSLRNADDGLQSPTGRETVEGVITYSFNVGAAAIGMRIGTNILYKYVDMFGFGKRTGIDLSGETEGILTPGKYWKPINLATISYGQGIAVTPLQMVSAFGAIANEGALMKPRVVRKIIGSDGRVYHDNVPCKRGQVLKPQTCHEMLKILTNVCENGTGKKARIPGYTVGGKTGTANVVNNGVYVGDKFIASFIGIVPIEDPRLVILIKIDEPKGVIWGGAVAAPVFNRVGSQILWRLGIQPTSQVTSENPLSPEANKENIEALAALRKEEKKEDKKEDKKENKIEKKNEKEKQD